MAEDRLNPLDNPAAAAAVAGRTPAAQRPEDSPDETFDAFVADALGMTPANDVPEEPEEPPAPATSPGAPEAPPGAAPAPAPVPPVAVPSPPQPPAQRFAYNGAYYTLEELATQGYVTEALQKATQFDMAQRATPAQPPGPPPAPPTVTPEQVQQAYAPMVKQLVETGWIDEDVAVLYPATIASMAQLHDRLQRAEQVLGHVATYFTQQQQQTVAHQAATRLDEAIAQAASRGELYQPLGDAKTRQGFREYLVNDVNPMLEQVTPDFVARQWFAYNQELLADLQRQVQARGTPPPAASPRPPPPAAGRGSARIRAPQATDEDEPWADMLRDIL